MIRGLPAFAAFAALAAQEIPLYPGPAPGSEKWTWSEEPRPSTDGLRRVRNVSRPVLTLYRPARPNGAALVICPGGGFQHLAIQHEGEQVAAWLNDLGITAFVLRYRLARTGDGAAADPKVAAQRRAESMPLAAADGRRAVALVRERAKEFGVRPDRVGIMGFSAGGWVAAQVALEHDAASRPDFAIPVYAGGFPANQPLQAPARPMPLLLIHADDDATVNPLSGTIPLYQAWRSVKAPAELHVYAQGGHGFGMKRQKLPVDQWTERARDWFAGLGLLAP